MSTQSEVNAVEKAQQVPAPSRRRLPPARERLRSERVEAKLAQMPGWSRRPGELTVDRVRELPSEGMAGAYAAFVQACAAMEKQSVRVLQAGNQVVVTVLGEKLGRSRRIWLTERSLDFAKGLG